MPALRVAAIRHVGPYNRIHEAFAQVSQRVGGAVLRDPQTLMIGVYHDNPEITPESELRADAGFSIAADNDLPAGLGPGPGAQGRIHHRSIRTAGVSARAGGRPAHRAAQSTW